MSRRPIRWRIAEAYESPRGWLIVVGIAAILVAVAAVPLFFRSFVARPAIPAIRQTEVRCQGAIAEIQKGFTFEAEDDDPRRLCVEKARARVVVGGIASFFIVLFAVIGLLVRAGKIRPKETAT